jgi:hypothetical protein
LRGLVDRGGRGEEVLLIAGFVFLGLPAGRLTDLLSTAGGVVTGSEETTSVVATCSIATTGMFFSEEPNPNNFLMNPSILLNLT